MRLHHLSVTAFGPFAGTVEVDFDAVGLAGLFLIQGPTGAGKTSLLDAICFALYAGVPGHRPGGRALRSDHAARDVVPSVRLDFTTGERRFRIRRSPEFMRPKKRGEGEVRTQATVVLEEQLMGRWVVRSTRADEVGEIVTEVLGMGLAQFSKVVLLPQGEFAAFLRATADERRVLLERLFDISTFAGIEAWLVDERRLRTAAVAESRALLRTDLARLEDVLAQASPVVVGPAPPTIETQLDRLPAVVEELGARLSTHANEALAALDAADVAAAAAAQGRTSAESLAELQRRGLAARAELVRLDATADEHAQITARLDAAMRAQAVSGDLRALTRLDERARLAQSDVAAARAVLERFGLSDWDAPAVRGWATSLQEHGAALDDAVRAAAALADVRARRERREADAATARQEEARLRAAAAARQTRHTEAAAALATAEVAVTDLATAGRDVERLEQAQRLRVERDRAAELVAELGGQVRAARDREQDARAVHQQLQQRRLDGMAAELAATLAPGEACAVCGALEHPRPATAGDRVTAADLDEAEAAWQQRRAETASLQQHRGAQEQLVATRTADLADSDAGAVDPSELARALAQAVARRDTAQAAAATVATATEVVTQTHRELEHTLESVATLRTSLTGLDAMVAELDHEQARRRGEVDQLLADHARRCPCSADAGAMAAAAEQQTHHARLVGAVERLLAALSRQADEAVERVTAERALSESLSANGFRDRQAADVAAIPPQTVADLQRRVKTRDGDRAAAQAVLADEQVDAALTAPAADVAGASAAAVHARTVLRTAQHEQTRAEATARAFTVVADSILDRVRRLGPEAAQAQRLAQLADTMTGLGADNALRMRLSSFVLAARLEKVAALANERLSVLGDGRYQLQHSDDLAGGGRRSGLGLVVHDLWTGQVRDTSSLSGGESFMASLALALGLADAVREEAGGFDLQTLFIDEGFGTLDDESLEQVLSVLDGLRDGGRAVGVVSHVADLRTRITAQISVTKRSTGSSVRVLGVDSPAA